MTMLPAVRPTMSSASRIGTPDCDHRAERPREASHGHLLQEGPEDREATGTAGPSGSGTSRCACAPGRMPSRAAARCPMSSTQVGLQPLRLRSITICVGVGSSPPKSRNIFSKTGITLTSRSAMTPTAIVEDRDRVDHGALHLLRELVGLLEIGGEAVQDRVQDAADLAGRDEVHEERREDLRVLAGAPRRRWSPARPALLIVPADLLEARVGSIWSPRIWRHCTSGRPASIITANWRVKTTRSFVLIFGAGGTERCPRGPSASP